MRNPRFQVVAIVATAGGVGALRRLLSDLPANFAAAVLCLQPSTVGPADLAELQSECRLAVRWAGMGERPRAGCVYLTPAGSTLLLREDQSFSLAPFATESESLSPADLFLGSVARAYGSHTLAVFLSGWGVDGLRGGIAIKSTRGHLLVREQRDAPYTSPIDSVIAAGLADRRLPLEELGLALKIALYAPTIVEPAQLREAVDPMLVEAMTVQESRAGAIYLRDLPAQSMQMLLHHNCDEELLSRFRILDPSRGEPCTTMISEGKRVVVEDVANDPLYARYRELAIAAGVGAVHIVPMPADDGEVLGMLSTIFSRPRPLAAREAVELDRIARDAGEALRSFL